MKITIVRDTRDGAYVARAITGNYFTPAVCMRYLGYTKKEVARLFREHLKQSFGKNYN